MEFYDKLVNRFQPRPVKSKESCCQQGQGLIIYNCLEISKENDWRNMMLSH